MAKCKKVLKKGWTYFENYCDFFEKIQNGISRMFIDNKYEIIINRINDDKKLCYFSCENWTDDLTYMGDFCDMIDADVYFIDYEAELENFKLIFSEIINQRRLCYAKRQ